MVRRKTVILIAAYLTAAALALGGFALWRSAQLRESERAVRYSRELAFEELCSAVGGLDTALRKSLYALSPGMEAQLAGEIYSRALSAAAALASLPGEEGGAGQSAAFLSQAGDFAAYLLKKTAAGGMLTDEEREGLRSLSETAGVYHESLRNLQTDLDAGLVLREADRESVLPTAEDSFLDMEREFPELASLVYDGPFSSGAQNRTPLMTEGAAEVTAEDARLIAAGFLNTRPNLISSVGETDGKLPCFRVTDGTVTVSITRSGGYVVRAISSAEPTRAVLSAEQAVDEAGKRLREWGFRSMEESYHEQSGNAMTVSFVYKTKGVLCYPDMVKITVSMETGELLRLDAENYLTSHHDRDLPPVTITAAGEAAAVAEGLEVLSVRTALIPSGGTEELLCREIVCENEDGEHVLVYANAETGVQERILLLLEDETGTLAL